MNRCPSCHRPLTATTDTVLCLGCIHRMNSWLREIPRHLPILRASLAPDTGPARRGGSGRAHAPLPVRTDVLNLLGPGHVVTLDDPHGDQSADVPITALLVGWARYIDSEAPADTRVPQSDGARPPRGRDVAAWCTWLLAYIPWVATRPWADEMYTQLENLVHRIRRITHTAPRARAMNAPCPGCDAFGLVAVDDVWEITCRVCPTRLTPDEYEAHRARIMPGLAAVALRIAAAHQTAA